jgi:hypothetical protein
MHPLFSAQVAMVTIAVGHHFMADAGHKPCYLLTTGYTIRCSSFTTLPSIFLIVYSRAMETRIETFGITGFQVAEPHAQRRAPLNASRKIVHGVIDHSPCGAFNVFFFFL